MPAKREAQRHLAARSGLPTQAHPFITQDMEQTPYCSGASAGRRTRTRNGNQITTWHSWGNLGPIGRSPSTVIRPRLMHILVKEGLAVGPCDALALAYVARLHRDGARERRTVVAPRHAAQRRVRQLATLVACGHPEPAAHTHQSPAQAHASEHANLQPQAHTGTPTVGSWGANSPRRILALIAGDASLRHITISVGARPAWHAARRACLACKVAGAADSAVERASPGSEVSDRAWRARNRGVVGIVELPLRAVDAFSPLLKDELAGGAVDLLMHQSQGARHQVQAGSNAQSTP